MYWVGNYETSNIVPIQIKTIRLLNNTMSDYRITSSLMGDYNPADQINAMKIDFTIFKYHVSN